MIGILKEGMREWMKKVKEGGKEEDEKKEVKDDDGDAEG